MDSDESDHPANKLILEKAMRSSKKPEQSGVFQFTAGGSKDKEIQANKRGRHEGSSDSSMDGVDERTSKKARTESISINLETNVEEYSTSDSGSESEEAAAQPLDFVPPRGVVMIGDDEEEVQVTMQKKLRAPRYFTKRKLTTMGASSRKCFNCGKTGHFSKDCPYSGRQKPCYLCAKFGHPDFQCPNNKSRCYHCNRLGHLARDCPNAHNAYVLPLLCTRCGDPACKATGQPDYVRAEGACNKVYLKEDLDRVRCQHCFQLGHLRCERTTADWPASSCHNCGERGHTGEQCDLERTYLATKERQEAGNLRGLDSIRSSNSEQGYGRASRDQGLAQHHSYDHSYPPLQPAYHAAPPPAPPAYLPPQPPAYPPPQTAPAAYWQHDSRAQPALPDPHHAAHSQPNYHNAGPSQYVPYGAVHYQQAGPPLYSADHSAPQYPSQQSVPYSLPPPQQQFQHSFGQFAMGQSNNASGRNRRNWNRR